MRVFILEVFFLFSAGPYFDFDDNRARPISRS